MAHIIEYHCILASPIEALYCQEASCANIRGTLIILGCTGPQPLRTRARSFIVCSCGVIFGIMRDGGFRFVHQIYWGRSAAYCSRGNQTRHRSGGVCVLALIAFIRRGFQWTGISPTYNVLLCLLLHTPGGPRCSHPRLNRSCV